MGFKIKNSLTGEFEKLPILTLKGEKGETGGVEEYNKVDYMGNKYETLKQANDANVEYAVKTAIGEFNYLDYDGQRITATDTIEGRSKSAILSGNTLVNLMTNCKDEYVVRYHNPSNPNHTVANISMMKPNTEYTLFYKAKYRLEGDGAGEGGVLIIATSIEQGFAHSTDQRLTTEYKQYVFKFTTSDIVDCFTFKTNGMYFAIKECVLLEGDHTNVDIPYFEGMASVKAPVLTTTGKNLFDGKLEKGSIYTSTGQNANAESLRSDYIKVKPDTLYIISSNLNYSSLIYTYDESKNYIKALSDKKQAAFTTPSNCKYIRFRSNINEIDLNV